MKLIYAMIPMLLAPVPVSVVLENISERNIDTANATKVLDIDFDNNNVVNNINNKVYIPSKNTAKYVSSLKGNSFEANDSVIAIPFSDISLDNTTDTITVSLLFKWEGIDTTMMPISIKGYSGHNNLWVKDGIIGFNTGNSEIYGVSTPLEKNKYYSIVAEFNNGDVSKNKLYIDGVKQNLSYVLGTSSVSHTWNGNSSIGIAGAVATPNYNINDKSIIDEVKIFKKSLTTDEVNSIANSHKIPILTTETVNNNYARASWATEMLPEDILWSIGYEEGDVVNFKYNEDPYGDVTGGQKIVTEEQFSGLNSRYSRKTSDYTGNKYEYPNTKGVQNYASFNRVPLPDSSKGAKVAVTSRVKTNADKVSLYYYTSWDWGKSFINYSDEVKVAEPVQKGSRTVKLTSLKGIGIKSWVCFDDDINDIRYNYTVNEIDKETNTVTLSGAIGRDVPANYQLKRRPPRYSMTFNNKTYQTKPNAWTLTSDTTTIDNSTDISYFTTPQYFRELITAYGDTYTDDIKVGYATKVRLYRDGGKVYEGYDSDYNDTSAIDKAKPNEVSLSSINSTMEMIDATKSQRKLKINFEGVTDNGTSYDYNISAISKEGKETPKGETLTQTVTSGLKGYSYVIDKSPTTIPSNTVNLTTNSIEKNITDSGVYYLHIKAIDNAGNSSNVIHYKIDIPTLTAKANPSSNNIRLDWALNDKSDKSYKVYQKKEGSNDFQSISMTDLESAKEVKVLNIYPYVNTEITFTNWKGETFTLPKSASIKKWMEEPNSEHPKGYGQGIITVDCVEIDDFNLNPDKYLKNADGSWKYDVINIGNWDSNNNKEITENTLPVIREFTESGRGLLMRHDTVHTNRKYFRQLRDLINIQIPGDSKVAESYKAMDYIVYADNVYKKKVGLLNNYPWIIDKENLVIPPAHTSYQWAFGDVWFELDKNYPNPPNGWGNVEYNGIDSKGTNAFYLTTWNNTAMVQTGHSNGEATEDEQKILANTLFYLNQLSSDNFLDDYSGQDVKAPNKPQIYVHKFTEDGYIEFKFNEVVDNGSEYSYYIESQTKDNHSLTLSNVVKETITSGLKGYSFVVDNKANTIPDDIIEQSTNETIKIKTNNNDELYVHIKAIDKVDNSSETYHYRITDTTAPNLELTLDPNSWTNGSVTINAKATDSGSGIKYLILPNGNMIKGTTGSYTVTENGKYYFKTVDYMGNETISSITVSNIDKKKPTVIINNNQNWTNQDVSVTITATDE